MCGLALAGSKSFAVAQNPPLVPPPSSRPGYAEQPQGSAASQDDSLCPSGGNGYQGNGAQGTEELGDISSYLAQRDSGSLTSSTSIGGVSVSSAANMNGQTFGTVATPVISAGLLTSANAESPYPMNRVFFNYSYYNQFQVSQTTIDPTATAPFSSSDLTTTAYGFNLNRFDVGIEKTIFGGLASVYFRAPFLSATGIDPALTNNPGSALNLNSFEGVGNVNAGLKVMLHQDPTTGNVFSAGVTVAAPTARSAYFPVGRVTVTEGDPFADPPIPTVLNINTQKVNPTYVQPWVAGQLNYDRWFFLGFLGVLTPTSQQVLTTLNPNVAAGYEIFRGNGGLITSVTPYVNCQVLAPFHAPAGAIVNFPTQVFVTEGVNVFFGERTALFAGVVTPVAGPQAFDIGATAGINYFY